MNNKDKMISIIVPVYKVEKYLRKCIESIIKQTYKNLQIILIDDGSPDNCGKICDEYAQKDNRIQVIHQRNKGLAFVRNVGLSKAKGEYIGFVDSDDYIVPDMFEYMYHLLEKNGADICICNFYNVIEDKINIKNQDNGIECLDKMQILKEILLDKRIQSYSWNKLYKREMFDGILYPEGKNYEDIGTTFYVFEKCNKVVLSGKPVYYYLDRPNSIVNNCTEQTIKDYVSLITSRYNYVDEKYDELKDCNDYYLLKTVITSFSDLKNLQNPSDDVKKVVTSLINKAKNIVKGKDIQKIKFFNDMQKDQLKNILYNEI